MMSVNKLHLGWDWRVMLCCSFWWSTTTMDQWWSGISRFEIAFPMKPGNMIFFQSWELLHKNFTAEGDHRSLVFSTDHNSFLSPGQHVTRKSCTP